MSPFKLEKALLYVTCDDPRLAQFWLRRLERSGQIGEAYDEVVRQTVYLVMPSSECPE